MHVSGEVNAKINFFDISHRKSLSIHNKLLIVKNLVCDGFLGFDVIGKPPVYLVTPTELLLSKNFNAQYNSSRLTKNENFIRVPFNAVKANPALNYTETPLESFRYPTKPCTATTVLNGPSDRYPTEPNTSPTVPNVLSDRYPTEPDLSPTVLNVPSGRHTTEPSASTTVTRTYSETRNQPTTNLLSELKGICNVYELDEIERKEVVDQFLEEGRADLPLNKYVEQTSSIQSFSLKDFEKVYETYDDLMALIDTSHLPQDCKK